MKREAGNYHSQKSERRLIERHLCQRLIASFLHRRDVIDVLTFCRMS